MASLDNLVDDIMIQIFQDLSVRDLLSIRKTSRRYYLLSKLHCVWRVRFCADVLERNLPLPSLSRPLSMLSAAQIEQQTLRALYLDQTWPRLSGSTIISTRHSGTSALVDQVVFLPGGTDVLTVQGDKVTHWVIISRPGIVQGLKYIDEYTPFEGVPCRIVKDGDAPGVIAVGPRELLGSHRFAKVLSTSLKAPFTMLCDYAHVPGVLAGVSGRLLLLDTTIGLDAVLELLDWHTQTSGTAVLTHIPDLFGSFLDFAVFAGHLLIVCEHGASVFPIPRVPADGRVYVKPKRMFMFQEGITRPVGFTTCIARRAVPQCLRPGVDEDYGADWGMDRDGRKQRSSFAMGMPPTLTIAGRSRRRSESISMVMLVPLVDDIDRETNATAYTSFPYRLTILQPHLPYPSCQYANKGGEDDEDDTDDYTPLACTNLCLGWSGRGVFVVGRELRLVSPGLHVLPPYEMQLGPVFETGRPIYRVDKRNWLRLNGDANMDEGHACADKVDFDEGMGRIVVAKERGGFEVLQLD